MYKSTGQTVIDGLSAQMIISQSYRVEILRETDRRWGQMLA